MEILAKLKQGVNIVKENEPLAPHTTFKIGGPARYFCPVGSVEELAKSLKLAEKIRLPYFILGGGSNVLISDAGFAGLVIKINFSRLKVKDNFLECEAGAWLSKVVGAAFSSGLAGLEWAVGIPGTVGGAVYGNAGAYGRQISDLVETVSVWRRGKEKILKNKDCGFGYRTSIFKRDINQGAILSVALKLLNGDKEKIKQKMKEILKQRKVKIDALPSAGSIFKNIELSQAEIQKFKKKIFQLPDEFMRRQKISAGWLIEQCSLKGKRVGGVMVSDKHANIIINTNGATAQDVMNLISIIKQKVKKKFDLELEEEIRYVGFENNF